MLERLNFLLIFSSNMDEFFEIRVAGLKHKLETHTGQPGPDGLLPEELLESISAITHEAVERQYRILNDVLLPALREEGVDFLRRENTSLPTRFGLRSNLRGAENPHLLHAW